MTWPVRICRYWPDSPKQQPQIIVIPNTFAAALAREESVLGTDDEADSSPLKRFGMTRLTKDTRQTEGLVSTHFFFGGVVRIYVIIQDLNELRHNLVAL
jgi:hypothetical protein